MSWLPVPEPVSWSLPVSIAHNGLTFTQIVLRAATGEDMLKATATPGRSNFDTTICLIEAVSGVPYDVVKRLPWYMIKQMSDYLDEFAGVPMPGPLVEWYAAQAGGSAKSPEAVEPNPVS